MKKLDCHIWSTVPAVGTTLEEMKDKINELINAVNSLQSQLLRINPDTKYGPSPIEADAFDVDAVMNSLKTNIKDNG